MWTAFFLAQHYDNIGNTESALAFIDRAIKHTPSVIDLYIAKGRIYKHAGDLEKASESLEYARSLDLADRYLNTLSAKYLLRNNNISRALEILSLFTRDSDEAKFYLMDMQSMNFSQELGESYIRTNEPGRALKQFVTIHKHFEEIIDDQVDFHSYCLRKMTLRAYVKMLRFENEVQSHKYYVRAAKQAVRTYLALHTKPAAKDMQEDDPSLANLDPSERRKILRKKKKEEEKKKAEQEKAEQEQKEKKDPKKKPIVYASGVDKDIQGQEYLDKPDKLEEASKFLKVLQQFAKGDIEASLLAAEVYLLKKKYLKVVQALNRAVAIDANNAQLHVLKIKFLQAVQPALSSLPAAVQTVLNGVIPKFTQGQALDKINADFFAKNTKSLAHRVAYAQASNILTSNASEAKVITPESDTKNLQDFVSAFEVLSNGPLANPTLAASFKEGAHKQFPYAKSFL